MPVEGHLYGDRTWFFDTRGSVRRMGVSAHAADATMVFSLWQGDVCTGTFRLPASEAPGLISALAYGMSEATLGQGAPEGSAQPRRPGRDVWARLVGRVVARLARAPGGDGNSHLRLLK